VLRRPHWLFYPYTSGRLLTEVVEGCLAIAETVRRTVTIARCMPDAGALSSSAITTGGPDGGTARDFIRGKSLVPCQGQAIGRVSEILC
jgi:hypothetical protein